MIPFDVVSRYEWSDVDAALVAQRFDAPPGSRVLEVGAHDSPLSNMLADLGYRVTGVDLREYNSAQDHGADSPTGPKLNYDYVRGDFCDMPDTWVAAHIGVFDAALCVSAVEHFGMGAYGEGAVHAFYDVVAMREIWRMLKPGGACHLTVPYGNTYGECWPHWRIYNDQALSQRLVQDFAVAHRELVVADAVTIDGVDYQAWDRLTAEQAARFAGVPPHVTVYLKLIKVPVSRLAPDGR